MFAEYSKLLGILVALWHQIYGVTVIFDFHTIQKTLN